MLTFGVIFFSSSFYTLLLLQGVLKNTLKLSPLSPFSHLEPKRGRQIFAFQCLPSAKNHLKSQFHAYCASSNSTPMTSHCSSHHLTHGDPIMSKQKNNAQSAIVWKMVPPCLL
jgi:hypothetical protein